MPFYPRQIQWLVKEIGLEFCKGNLFHSEASGMNNGRAGDPAFQVPAPDFALAVLKGLSHIAPHAHALRLKNEDFSRSVAVVEAMNNDPLIAHEVQPTKTMQQLVLADERLKAEMSAVTLPLYIIHVDKEVVMAGILEWLNARV
jgi:alpha-beta hydrolase superfamily lysophospholipase